ncbi:MAG: hypothetical protein C0508_26600, partial [Cyanobacteria bacterium PR.023]|nr:hypothetical protein [Cyanobacteria bacterium PR.023]
MIYRTKRFSASVVKPKKHICYGRPSAVYFSNEKELIRMLAIGFLFCLLVFSFDGVRLGIKFALCGGSRSVERSPSEAPVEEIALPLPPQPGYDPVFGPPLATNLVTQQGEQNSEAVAQNIEQQFWPEFGAYNEADDGLTAFWSDDIISNFFANIGQLVEKWIGDFLSHWRGIFGLPALFALDSYRRSLFRRPAWKKKLKINPASARPTVMLL